MIISMLNIITRPVRILNQIELQDSGDFLEVPKANWWELVERMGIRIATTPEPLAMGTINACVNK